MSNDSMDTESAPGRFRMELTRDKGSGGMLSGLMGKSRMDIIWTG